MSGNSQGKFRQLTKLPSATADSDVQVGLGIPSSFTKPSLSGHFLYTGRYAAFFEMTFRQIILTTMITVLTASLAVGLFAFIKEKSFQSFLYGTMMTPGNIIIPIFMGVVIYILIKKKIGNEFGPWNRLFKIIVLAVISQIGLIVWSVLDLISFSGSLSGVTFENIIDDYKNEFSAWSYVAILSSILIPILDTKVIQGTKNAA